MTRCGGAAFLGGGGGGARPVEGGGGAPKGVIACGGEGATAPGNGDVIGAWVPAGVPLRDKLVTIGTSFQFGRLGCLDAGTAFETGGVNVRCGV